MPTPASGQIALSDVAWVVYNNYSTQVTLNDGDVRTLAGIGSGQISLANLYNKPTAGNTGGTYYSPGSYTWIVVPYQTLYAQVAGGGGGGGGGCGGQAFTYGCVNFCASSSGTGGAGSTFNGLTGNGGGGGGQCNSGVGAAGGGSGGTVYTGSGGAGGAGGVPGGVNCNQSNGSAGGAGGRTDGSWRKGSNGPAYGASLGLSVGGGGTGVSDGCRPAPGATGGSGWVYIAWS